VCEGPLLGAVETSSNAEDGAEADAWQVLQQPRERVGGCDVCGGAAAVVACPLARQERRK
jgi:hypothetical protein